MNFHKSSKRINSWVNETFVGSHFGADSGCSWSDISKVCVVLEIYTSALPFYAFTIQSCSNHDDICLCYSNDHHGDFVGGANEEFVAKQRCLRNYCEFASSCRRNDDWNA